MAIEFKYENASDEPENGYYILDVTYPENDQRESETIRYIAEYYSGNWYPTGADYDAWQYGKTRPKIVIIARIYPDKLMIIEVVE